MRRSRKDATQVWHNPEINTFVHRGEGPPSSHIVATSDDAPARQQHRAALEALFTPRRLDNATGRSVRQSGPKAPTRIVLAPPPQTDAKTDERQRLLSKLLVAESRPKVSKAADDYVRAGFPFPHEQDVHLQLLEHTDEEHVRAAIETLGVLLGTEPPKRKAVLESRLRRIEQFAEETATRTAAEGLRRRVSSATSSPPVRSFSE